MWRRPAGWFGEKIDVTADIEGDVQSGQTLGWTIKWEQNYHGFHGNAMSVWTPSEDHPQRGNSAGASRLSLVYESDEFISLENVYDC